MSAIREAGATMAPDARAALISAFARRLHAFQAQARHFEVVTTVHNAADLLRPQLAPATPPPRQHGPRTLIVLDSSFNPPTKAHMRMATAAVQELASGDGGSRRGGLRVLLLLAVNNADKGAKPAAFEHRLVMMRQFAVDMHDELRGEETGGVVEKQGNTTTNTESEEGGKSSSSTPPIDIGLTTYPFFHEKSASIASSAFYNSAVTSESGGGTSTSPIPGDADSATAPEQVFLAGYDTLIRIFNPKYYSPPIPADAGVTTDTADRRKTPMQTALDPFLTRARLRVTMRTDDGWGGRDEQEQHVRALAEGGELEQVGGRREWARRIDLVEGGGEVVSSTLARRAAKEGKWEVLGTLVSQRVGEYVRSERLYTEDA
ncbi:Cytidylyltransferase family protein [Pleurostoma richardsiae]|uniref:Cytidylyltransferase family protein n=1 Tax=Pleurostoma richardsiae TaxID=41990 RepID=A0AA38RYP6_9PEZI|nr:Cytidylyltransferase family protein [Pleurostoma richardsiae]